MLDLGKLQITQTLSFDLQSNTSRLMSIRYFKHMWVIKNVCVHID